MTSSHRGYSPSRNEWRKKKFFEKIWGKKFGGKKILAGNKFFGKKNFGEKKNFWTNFLRKKHFWEKKFHRDRFSRLRETCSQRFVSFQTIFLMFDTINS